MSCRISFFCADTAKIKLYRESSQPISHLFSWVRHRFAAIYEWKTVQSPVSLHQFSRFFPMPREGLDTFPEIDKAVSL